MAQDEQSPTSEEHKGSIIPAVGGGAVGGAAGGVWGYRNSQKKAVAALTYDHAAQGTDLGRLKEHITAAQQGHVQAMGLQEEWERLVTLPMTEAPKRPAVPLGASTGYKKTADLDFRREKAVYDLNHKWHKLKDQLVTHPENQQKHVLQGEVNATEAALHNAAAEHLVTRHELKPLSKEIMGKLEGVTSKLPSGGKGRMLVGAAVVGAIGALGAQAMFGRAERPHPSHAARIRTEQRAAEQEQGQSV